MDWYSDRDKDRDGVLCANCGRVGHTFMVCKAPITSFGVICYRQAARTGGPQYLMVQRRDSLCYAEFIRGKYALDNVTYLACLFNNMTADERSRLLVAPFDSLWFGFWQDESSRNFMREYHASKSQFEALRAGYQVRGCDRQFIQVDLAGLLGANGPGFPETEWGFPKGRRNINETDAHCALREFTEETGVEVADVCAGHRTFEEVFTGCNRTRYRHVYYVVRATAPDLQDLTGDEGGAPSRPVSSHQKREIRRVAWFGYDALLARIRPVNVERRAMFLRAHAHVMSQLRR